MTLHLYAAATSNAQRAACMLEELGLPYTLHKVDLAKGAQKTPEFLAINPAGQVPALSFLEPESPPDPGRRPPR